MNDIMSASAYAQAPQPALYPGMTPPPPEQIRMIVGKLQAEVTARIGKRQSLEDRWILDTQQYHGYYDDKTDKNLRDEKRSRLFINQTAPKTDSLAARVKDLLFPTDDKNWGINPTPVPELSEVAEKAAQQARQAAAEAAMAAQQPQVASDAGATPEEIAGFEQQAAAAQAKADAFKEASDLAMIRSEEGRRRADLMEKEIDDQLTECRYQVIKRDQIDCGMRLGTGVTKGPVTGDNVRRGWKQQENGEHVLEMSAGNTPAFRMVDLWNFFPDMDATKIEDSNGEFERHLMNTKKLRRLQHMAGFDKDALRRLLHLKPSMAAPSYLAQLRNIRAAQQQVTGDLYHVFEYNGPLDYDDMRDLAHHIGTRQNGTLQNMGSETLKMLDSIDILKSVNACVWFCQGEVLKFAIYPLDSNETLYSVFTLRRDESSIFGYGMPAILRDPQAGLNGAVRTLMDNAGVASGPQIVIDKQNVEPEDGEYILKPRKIWMAKNGMVKEALPFQSFDIPMHAQELILIIQLFEHFMDTMSSMPSVMEGQPGDPGSNQVTNTALGTAILHNSANILFRAIVKNFDDDVTTPDIRRIYDWNMQFSQKEEIKGDYNVDARGSSVLLVREMQAQNLLIIALQLGGHPIFGPMLRNRELLKKIFQAYMIPADEVMLTDDEIDAVLAAAAAQSEAAIKAQAEKEKLATQTRENQAERSTKIAIANANNETKLQIADMDYDQVMNHLAGGLNMKVNELEARLAAVGMQTQSKERMFASEVAVDQAMAADARAHGEIPKGSGGSVSAGATKKGKK